MTQNDNADFITQLEHMSEQMEHEFHGMGRAISKVSDWTERANMARLALESMEMQKAELMGIVSRVCAPPALPNYNQIPERQEIEFEAFEVPRMWKQKLAALTVDDITDAVSRIKRGQAA